MFFIYDRFLYEEANIFELMKSDPQGAIKYIKRKKPVHQLNKHKETLLAAACREELHIDLVKALIDAGSDINATEQYFPPLINAAMDNEGDEIVKLLIQSKADLEIKSAENETALQHAILNTKSSKPALALIEAGANLNVSDELGYSVLMLAIKEENTEVVERLLSKKVDVNYINEKYNLTALNIALCFGEPNIDLIEILLKAGANPEIGVCLGQTIDKYLKFEKNESLNKLFRKYAE